MVAVFGVFRGVVLTGRVRTELRLEGDAARRGAGRLDAALRAAGRELARFLEAAVFRDPPRVDFRDDPVPADVFRLAERGGLIGCFRLALPLGVRAPAVLRRPPALRPVARAPAPVFRFGWVRFRPLLDVLFFLAMDASFSWWSQGPTPALSLVIAGLHPRNPNLGGDRR
ncbi:MAG: hypothetical protein H0W08_00950 [Acidobacteria bacterium]|nr:hypothetical protein [Acidobacteriota bacterium]